MRNFIVIRDDILNGRITIDELSKYQEDFEEYASEILIRPEQLTMEEIYSHLMLCLDYYTYSSLGDSLIKDKVYDACYRVYLDLGGQVFYCADSIQLGTRWNFINHRVKGMVGTLSKIYTFEEFKSYIRQYSGITEYIVAPKYDGVSCVIEVRNGKIISAATRYDGESGQDITSLAQNAKNAYEKTFILKNKINGYYKCELCVGTTDYLELFKEKPYANRRSATTGIINTPSNLNFARYVTIVPLVFYDDIRKTMDVVAPYKATMTCLSPMDFWEIVQAAVSTYKSREFQYRVDGIVLYPVDNEMPINEDDILEQCIAFKVNTSEAPTTIKYGYTSVGRLGKAVPMVKVEPVEVNETMVEDVSLGSFAKYLEMNLAIGEEVIVYSAGDVIPQVKLPDRRVGSFMPPLEIKRSCPYCNKKLKTIGGEMYCANQNCMRVITGKITNFLTKMDIKGFSDKTVESIYEFTGIRTIPEFLSLTKDDIIKIPGFDISSSVNLENELHGIMNRPVTISKLLGALGIERISQKKCQKILTIIPFMKILKSKNISDLQYLLQEAEGIGPVTAQVFVDFVEMNIDLIYSILSLMTDVKDDIIYRKNFVFTGLRPSKDVVDGLSRYGYGVSDTVNKETVAVFTASMESKSSKIQRAKEKGVPIYMMRQFDEILQMELHDNYN